MHDFGARHDGGEVQRADVLTDSRLSCKEVVVPEIAPKRLESETPSDRFNYKAI
jgi:hypothetical protein